MVTDRGPFHDRPDGRDEQTLDLLRGSVRGLLERRWPADQALELPSDPDALAALWSEAASLGWTDLGRPGTDDGVSAALVVLQELGRAACPLPILGTLLAVWALDFAPEPGQISRALSGGTGAVAAALGEEAGERGGGSAGARSDGRAGFSVSGRLRFVEGLPLCSRLLVLARPGPLLTLVDAAAPGVSATPTPGLAVPPLHDLVLDGVAALAAWEVDTTVVGDLVLIGRLACTARALGAAQRSFELATEHARTRQQFGSPIGRFQAVQHKLADSLTLLDASRLLVERAGHACDTGRPSWRTEAAAATAFAAPALRRVVREAQHVLAGVGYIEEHEAPRHFRRVNADTLRFGGVAAGRAALAAATLDA